MARDWGYTQQTYRPWCVGAQAVRVGWGHASCVFSRRLGRRGYQTCNPQAAVAPASAG